MNDNVMSDQKDFFEAVQAHNRSAKDEAARIACTNTIMKIAINAPSSVTRKAAARWLWDTHKVKVEARGGAQ